MADEIEEDLAKAQKKAFLTRLSITHILQENGSHVSQQNIAKDSDKEYLSSPDKKILDALERISPTLASGYIQVKTDLQDEKRASWVGTAHEIREVLTNLLRTLAPDNEVCNQSWFKQEEETSGPTQKQRVVFILKQRHAGSKEVEVVSKIGNLEEMIGELVRSVYSRASDASHRAKEKREVVRIVRYFEAFAYDLLNL